MIRTTAPRKRDAVGFRAKRRACALRIRTRPGPCRMSRQLDLLSRARRPHLSPRRARGSGTLVPRARGRLPTLPGSAFPRSLGHATVVSKPGADVRWRAPLVGLQLALLFLPLGCAAHSRMLSRFRFRPPPRTAVSGGWRTARRKDGFLLGSWVPDLWVTM
jgi:hypothetical protein